MASNSKLIVFLFLTCIGQLHAQKIVKTFYSDSISSSKIDSLRMDYCSFKTIPSAYEKQIITALYFYPELKNTTIIFRFSKKTTPLSTKPTLISMFRNAQKRTYIITISTKTTATLKPILFQNLPFNAQVGVIGHELAHVADYVNKGFGKMSYIFYIEMLSKKKTDVFEHNTDVRCINHGLGYQLLDWSTWLRKQLNCTNWRGAGNLIKKGKKERYLNPNTIQNFLETTSIYKK